MTTDQAAEEIAGKIIEQLQNCTVCPSLHVSLARIIHEGMKSMNSATEAGRLADEIDMVLSGVPEDIHLRPWTKDACILMRQAREALRAAPQEDQNSAGQVRTTPSVPGHSESQMGNAQGGPAPVAVLTGSGDAVGAEDLECRLLLGRALIRLQELGDTSFTLQAGLAAGGTITGISIAASPAPASPGEGWKQIVAATLKEHFLCAIQCDHAAGTDMAICSCSRVGLGVHKTVGEAVGSWIVHVMNEVSRAAAPKAGG